MGKDVERAQRILVAEDDADTRRMVIYALRKEGHEIVDVTDGGKLLVAVTAFYRSDHAPPIDLIVSDVRMPVCSGLDILQQLRAAHWATPVVLMTAYGDDETRTRALALNAVLLDKPFKMRALRAVVRRLLRLGSTPKT